MLELRRLRLRRLAREAANKCGEFRSSIEAGDPRKLQMEVGQRRWVWSGWSCTELDPLLSRTWKSSLDFLSVWAIQTSYFKTHVCHCWRLGILSSEAPQTHHSCRLCNSNSCRFLEVEIIAEHLYLGMHYACVRI